MTALLKGLPGNGTYGRCAPCGAITRPMLLHHSVGHDREAAKNVSRTIDQLIDEFHREYLEGRAAGTSPQDPNGHEKAMRLLAVEPRFARRMIVDALISILDEPERHTFWASTVPSPTTPNLRYVWLAYPKPPADWPDEKFPKFLHDHLSQHMIVAADTFDEDILVGLAVPNRSAGDTLMIIQVLDASNRSEATKLEAEHWRARGIFSNLEAEHKLHIP